jgi:integrase
LTWLQIGCKILDRPGGAVKIEFKKAALSAIMPDPAKTVNYWDSAISGLALRVTPAGAKTFIYKYRHGSRQIWQKLGRLGDLTIEQARKRAAEIRLQVLAGVNPSQAIKERRHGLTVKEAAHRFYNEHRPHLRPRTAKDYDVLIRCQIVPTLGNVLLKELSPANVSALHHKYQHRPVRANHAVVVLSLICKYAETWGERPLGSNPCRHIKKYKIAARHRYLSDKELQAVGKAIDELDEHMDIMADCLRLLILTGARAGEIMNLAWQQVDLDNARLLFDPMEHKTGGMAHAKQIPLGKAAVEVLARRLRSKESDMWVFPGSILDMPITTLRRPWDIVKQAAAKDGVDISDVRIHDLRHTWGAVATSGGHALQTIGAVMGHRNTSTTQRYAHVAPSPAAKAVQDTSQRIADAMKGKK